MHQLVLSTLVDSCVDSKMQSGLRTYLLTGPHKPEPRLDPVPAHWLPLWDGMSNLLFCCVRFCGVAWHHCIVAWMSFQKPLSFLLVFAIHLMEFMFWVFFWTSCISTDVCWSPEFVHVRIFKADIMTPLLLLWMFEVVQWPQCWPLLLYFVCQG